MMSLELMWRVLEYLSEDTTQLIEEILARWTNEAEDIQFFRSSANFVFTFQMSSKPYFLRFNHESERTVETIEQELAFVIYLAEKGLRLAKPIASLRGAFVERISTKLGTFHAVVFEALEGKSYDINELNSEQLYDWGKGLGELHNLASNYPNRERATWQTQLDWVADTLAPNEIAALQVANSLKEDLSALSVSPNTYGLIHGDFELDNIIWQENRVQILDFDDCMYSWFAADIIYALSDLFDDNPGMINLDNAAFQSFIAGYRSAKQLPDEALALLPLLLRFDNLLKFTKLMRSRETFDKTSAPQWAHQLDNKLETKLISYRASFSLYSSFSLNKDSA